MEKVELYLGRDVNNDITINDPEVSRRHAHLVREGESYLYEDLGSTNGSFILGQRINSPIFLHPGTTITIGERVILCYSVEGFDPSETVAVPRQNYVPKPAAPAVQAPPIKTNSPIPPALPVAPPSFSSEAVPPAIPPAVPQKKVSKGLVVILIILGVILVFCVIPWIIVEITNSYCSLFAGFFNAIQPGVCP